MADRNRRGFTLVELLVVIGIIGLLVALLLPAVLVARARARQTQCSHRQHDIAAAIAQYETAKHHLPGYANELRTEFVGAGSDPDAFPYDPANPNNSPMYHRLSWAAVLLPYVGRNDVWEIWRETNRTMAGKCATALVDVPEFQCPSDDLPESGGLSYVANCGIRDKETCPCDPSQAPVFATTDPDGRNLGVFHDQTPESPNQIPMFSDKMPDGTEQTLLFSENNQALQWAPYGPPGSPSPIKLEELDVCMVWWPSRVFSPLGDGYDDAIRVNVRRDVGSVPTIPGSPYDPYGRAGAPGAGVDPYLDQEFLRFARPAGHHAGGAVVTYVSGRQDFLSEDIDYEVLQRLMSPASERAAQAGLIP